MLGCKRKFLILFFSLLIGVMGPVCAANSDSIDQWEVDLQLHLWAALPDGTTARGNDLQIDVLDLLDNVDFFYMGSIGAHSDRWLVLGDVLAFSLSGQDTDTVNVLGRPVDTSFNFEIVNDFFWKLEFYANYDSDPISKEGASTDYGVTSSFGYKF